MSLCVALRIECLGYLSKLITALIHHVEDFLREEELAEFVAEVLHSMLITYETKSVSDTVLRFVDLFDG